MRIVVILFLIFTFANISSFAQNKVYTLRECIDYAFKNNIQLRQAILQSQSSLVQLEQSKWTKWPTLNAQTSLNLNSGRNVDPFSNNIVTQNITTNNLGLGANVTLYNGNKIKNTISQNDLNLEAANLDIETQKNNIAIQVTQAYLNLLSTEELINVAEKQVELTNIQLNRTKVLVEAGSVAEVDLYDLQSQLANDELNYTNAKNNFESAIISLKQSMNIANDERILPQKILIPDPKLSPYPQSVDQIFDIALNFLPEIKAANVRVKSADLGIAISKSVGLPRITAAANYGTTYSSAAKNYVNTGTTYTEIPVTANFEDQTIPFILNFPQNNTEAQDINYFKQFKNNQSFNVGFSLSVPIFNGFNKRYQVQLSEINKKNAEINIENTALTIRQAIENAYINMENAQKRYAATIAQVNALEKSFAASDLRFSAGAGTFIDYNIAKTNLERAKSNLIQTKYDYVFKIKILDFYQNKPLAF